ncbi:13983_t:CDS:10, partial [Entrophospora sp. SA101]
MTHKNILIIGRTGQGKSALANVLVNSEQNFREGGTFDEFFKEGKYGISQTKGIQTKEFEIGDEKYRIVDTIGIGDTDMKPSKVLRMIAKGCKEVKDGLNQVLFVNGEKFTSEEIEAYTILRKVLFDEEIVNYTTIIRTRFDNFGDEEECKEDVKKLLESENEKITEMIESCNRKIIHVNNPSLNIILKNNVELSLKKININKEERLASREILIKYLEENCQSTYRPENLDKINKKIDDYLIKEDENLRKELKTLKKKVNNLKEEGDSVKEKELLKMQMETIKELIKKNNELMEKGLFEAVGRGMDKIVDKSVQAAIEVGQVLNRSLANVLTNSNKFKESSYAVSETRKTQFEEFEYERINYRIIDTIGIGDTRMPLEKVLYKLAKLAYSLKDGLNQILFVSDGKFAEETKSTFKLLKEVFFDEDINQYTTVVRTKFPNFDDDDECSKDKAKLIEESGELRKTRNKSREILLKHLSTYGNIYRSTSLDNLNKRIDGYIKREEELREETKSEFKKSLEEVRKDKRELKKKITREFIQHIKETTQKWFDEKYLDKNISELNISGKKLKGTLKIKGFSNLEILNCSDNKLIELKVCDCPKLKVINCSKNRLASLKIKECLQLTELNCSNNLITDFCFDSLNPNKITMFNLMHNDFSKKDLSCFSQFVNLTSLLIGTNERRPFATKSQLFYNRFYGSLEPLKNLTKLEKLDISGTNVSEGLEYLPKKLRKFEFSDNDESNSELSEGESSNQSLSTYHSSSSSGITTSKSLSVTKKKPLSQETELKKKNEELEGRLDNLEEEVQSLRRRLERLEKVNNKKQYGFPDEAEIERVIKRVTQPGYRRINKLLPPNASEQDKVKYNLCKSIIRYSRENNLSEQELKQRLNIDQVKLEYVLFCHLDRFNLEELIDYVAKLMGHLENPPREPINTTTHECDVVIFGIRRTILKISPHLQKRNEEFHQSKKKKFRENLSQYLLDDKVIKDFVQQLREEEVWFEGFKLQSISKNLDFCSKDCFLIWAEQTEVNLRFIDYLKNQNPDLQETKDKLDEKNEKELDISEKSLEGSLDLSDFVNLESLNCINNRLTILNVGACNKLRELYCKNNCLISINYPISNPEKLTNLSIRNNNLPKQDLSAFSKFVNLKGLYVGNDEQEKIKQGINNHFVGSLEPLKNLTNLKILDISNTDVDSGLEYLPESVEEIYCLNEERPESKVSKIRGELEKSSFLFNGNDKYVKKQNAQEWLNESFPKNEVSNLAGYEGKTRDKITELDISEESLEGKLDLSDFTNLEMLDCSYNQLTSLNVNSCQKLKYISCGFNKLTNLDLTNLTQLKIIECNDNHLTKFDYSSLKNSEKLTYLNIKHLVNDIYNKFTGSLEPLKDLKQLKDLHISNTDIDSGLEHLSESMETITCESNENFKVKVIAKTLKYFNQDIKKYKEFANRKKRKDIAQLNISNITSGKNKTQELKGGLMLKGFTKLQELDCSKNQLTNLDLSDCKKLQKLDCSNNQFANTEFLEKLVTKGELKVLKMSNNKEINSLDFLTSFENLEELDISGTNIEGNLKSLKKSLKKLKTLNITNTKISEGFEHLEGLERLACGKTEIKDELTKYENKANHDTSSVISLERLFVIRIGGSLVLIGQSDTENPNSQLYTQTGGVIAIVSPFMEILTSYINDKLFEVRQAEWDAFVEDAKNLLDNYHDLQVMLGGIEKKEVGEVNTALNDLRDKTKTFLDNKEKGGKAPGGSQLGRIAELIRKLEESINSYRQDKISEEMLLKMSLRNKKQELTWKIIDSTNLSENNNNLEDTKEKPLHHLAEIIAKKLEKTIKQTIEKIDKNIKYLREKVEKEEKIVDEVIKLFEKEEKVEEDIKVDNVSSQQPKEKVEEIFTKLKLEEEIENQIKKVYKDEKEIEGEKAKIIRKIKNKLEEKLEENFLKTEDKKNAASVNSELTSQKETIIDLEGDEKETNKEDPQEQSSTQAQILSKNELIEKNLELERESFDKLVVDEAKRRTFFSYRGHEPYGTINNKQYCASCWKCANCQQHLGKMVNGYNGTIYEENEEKEKSDKITHCFVLYCKTCYKEETCSNCNRLTERDLCLECSVQARIRDEFNNSYGETPPPTHTFYNKCECGNSKPTSNIRCGSQICENIFCGNYFKIRNNPSSNNSSSKFKKGGCRKCVGKKVKQKVERWFTNIKNDERYQTGLTEEEKREGEKMANELFQAIEEEIYPERKKGNSGSGWIWLLVIVGVVAVGVIGRSCKDKIPIWGAVGRDSGNMIARAVPNNQQSTLVSLVKDNIKKGSDVYSDELPAYEILAPFKRSIYGIYHNISRKHAQRYIDEITFRYNTRKYEEKERFDLALLSNMKNKNTEIIEAKYKGELDLVGFKISCYVLEDGRRILSNRGTARVLKMTDEGDKQARKIGYGNEATLLPDICDVFLEARRNINLLPRQKIIADQCEIIMRAFSKEMFPLGYYKDVFGVYDVSFTPENIRRKPRFIGSFVLKEIKSRTPKTKGGHYKKRFHQSLTPLGKKAVEEIINTVRTLAWVSGKDRNKFRRLVKERLQLERELPYIDVEAMDDSKKETDFDKVLKTAINTPPLKLKDLKEKLKKANDNNKCYRCQEILWGASVKDIKGNDYCLDCSKCSQCHLKLTGKYHVGLKGGFWCSDCVKNHRIKEVATAQQEIKKLAQEREELQKQLDELNNPASHCEICSKKIKGGDTYYATSQEPDKKTCPTCYQDQIDKRLAETKRKKKELERENEEVNDIMEQAEQANLAGKVFVLSERGKKLLGSKGVKIVEDGNNLVRKQQNQDSQNNYPTSHDNQRFNDNSKKDQGLEYLTPLLVGGGIIIIIICLIKSGKSKQQAFSSITQTCSKPECQALEKEQKETKRKNQENINDIHDEYNK